MLVDKASANQVLGYDLFLDIVLAYQVLVYDALGATVTVYLVFGYHSGHTVRISGVRIWCLREYKFQHSRC